MYNRLYWKCLYGFTLWLVYFASGHADDKKRRDVFKYGMRVVFLWLE